jgi:hypothetical protein
LCYAFFKKIGWQKNYLQGLCTEKDSEMSTVELLDSSPAGDFHIILNNLEIVIQKVQLKRKGVIYEETGI